MLYQVSHQTRFNYAQPVIMSRQLLRMTPRSFEHQTLQRSSVTTQPAAATSSVRDDYFGNQLTDLDIHEEHSALRISANSLVEVRARQDLLLDLSPAWNTVAAGMRVPETRGMWEAARFCFASPRITLEQVSSYASASFTNDRPLLPAVRDLTTRIFQDFEYAGGVTDIYTPITTVLRTRSGVCQDFAHLAIACLRSLGLPARYVSGYLLTRPPPGTERLVGADASHAWFATWCPKFGWVDFDPTNDLLPAEEHITLGWGRDYGDVAPSVGVIRGGGRQQLDVSVDVRPLTATEENSDSGPAGRRPAQLEVVSASGPAASVPTATPAASPGPQDPPEP